MAKRGRMTFAKRQKERARQEKQKAKAARRVERKAQKALGSPQAEGENVEEPGKSNL